MLSGEVIKTLGRYHASPEEKRGQIGPTWFMHSGAPITSYRYPSDADAVGWTSAHCIGRARTRQPSWANVDRYHDHVSLFLLIRTKLSVWFYDKLDDDDGDDAKINNEIYND